MHIIPLNFVNATLILAPYVTAFFVHRKYFNLLLTLPIFFATAVSSVALIYLANGIPF